MSEPGAELFIGLVGAVGADLDLVTDSLREALARVNYRTHVVRLSALVHQFDKWKSLPDTPLEARYDRHMEACTQLREMTGKGDALAVLTITEIAAYRQTAGGSASVEKLAPLPRQAYILRSLKRPEEVHTLRRVYGASFLLVSAYAPRQARLQALAKKVAESHHKFETDASLSVAQELVARDESEAGRRLGQNVRETFPLADVFVNVNDQETLDRSIGRFIDLVFGHPYHTPTRDEYGMFHARAAALRSAALGRQVGAAISTIEGDIVALGTNEVPKPGGQYWSEDRNDHRDFRLGYDTNDSLKRRLLGDLFNRLIENNWLAEDKASKGVERILDELLGDDECAVLSGARVTSLIEFGRPVHAEMAAIVDAARRGVSIRGCNLYTTTFPCHECARHIITAGIRRVVYIEPYPKSLAVELHDDSMALDLSVDDSRVQFTPFVGVAPRQYMQLFTADQRKSEDGKIIPWDIGRAYVTPRVSESAFSYLAKENVESKELAEKLLERDMVSRELAEKLLELGIATRREESDARTE